MHILLTKLKHLTTEIIAPLTEHVLPVATILSQMNKAIPSHGGISAGAIISIRECVSAFINTVTNAANTRCRQEIRSTITGEDVLIALNNLGFYHYVGPLFILLNTFRQSEDYENPSVQG